MMEQKLNASELLKIRERNLAQQRNLWDLKAWGKYNGKDVFTWLNPDKQKLIATLESMPYPIFWFTTEGLFHELSEDLQTTFPNVKNVLIVPSGNTSERIFGDANLTPSFADALRAPEINKEPGIVIATARGVFGQELIRQIVAHCNNNSLK